MSEEIKSDYVCPACEDTGVNSRGSPCHPCCVNGRNILKDRVLKAVGEVFDKNRNPDEGLLAEAIRWAYTPRVQYACGFREKGGGLAMFAGPVPNTLQAAAYEPPDDDDRIAYMVKIVHDDHYGEPKITPIGKWNGRKWLPKKKR